MKNARYDATLKDPLTGKERKVSFKTFHKLLGLVTYLDWIMIITTTLTTCSMMLETPQVRVMDQEYLQVRKCFGATLPSSGSLNDESLCR